MASLPKSKRKPRPKGTATPGAPRGAGATKRAPRSPPSLAAFFHEVTGAELGDILVLGRSAYWLPRVPDCPGLVAERSSEGTKSLLGVALAQYRDPRVDASEYPGPRDTAVAERWADSHLGIVRGATIRSLATAHPLRRAVLTRLELNARHSKACRLEVEERAATETGPEPKTVEEVVASLERRVETQGRWPVAPSSPTHETIEAILAAEAAMPTLDATDEHCMKCRRLAPHHLDIVVAHQVSKRIGPFNFWSESPGRPAAAAKTKRTDAGAKKGRKEARHLTACPGWAKFSIVVNAAADVLILGQRSGSVAEDFAKATTALARSPEEVEDTLRRLRSYVDVDVDVDVEKGRRKLTRRQANLVRRVIWALDRPQAVPGPRRRGPIPNVAPGRCDGAWSIAERIHDDFGGRAFEKFDYLKGNERIAAIVRAAYPEAEPATVGLFAAAAAVVAQHAAPAAAVDPRLSYIADVAEYLVAPRRDVSPEKAAAERDGYWKIWRNACAQLKKKEKAKKTRKSATTKNKKKEQRVAPPAD